MPQTPALAREGPAPPLTLTSAHLPACVFLFPNLILKQGLLMGPDLPVLLLRILSQKVQPSFPLYCGDYQVYRISWNLKIPWVPFSHA